MKKKLNVKKRKYTKRNLKFWSRKTTFIGDKPKPVIEFRHKDNQWQAVEHPPVDIEVKYKAQDHLKSLVQAHEKNRAEAQLKDGITRAWQAGRRASISSIMADISSLIYFADDHGAKHVRAFKQLLISRLQDMLQIEVTPTFHGSIYEEKNAEASRDTEEPKLP